MSTYAPAPGVHIGRPPCSNCGANFHLHRPSIGPLNARVSGTTLSNAYTRGEELWCPEQRPEPARAETLDAARAELALAEASGDEARVFVARGNVQRLMRRADDEWRVAHDPEYHTPPSKELPASMREPMGGWEPRS